MSPILGIYASSMQPALSATSYESIATVTVGSGGSSTVTFSSIPQTYKHLQIRMIGRSSRSVGAEGAWFYFNGDTSSTTNYVRHVLEGDGASVTASASAPTAGGTAPYYISGATALSNTFGVGVADILDYTDTNKYKTIRVLTGLDVNGSGGAVRLLSGFWKLNTNAITSITFDTQGGGNFAQYSSFALYGIKGA